MVARPINQEIIVKAKYQTSIPLMTAEVVKKILAIAPNARYAQSIVIMIGLFFSIVPLKSSWAGKFALHNNAVDVRVAIQALNAGRDNWIRLGKASQGGVVPAGVVIHQTEICGMGILSRVLILRGGESAGEV